MPTESPTCMGCLVNPNWFRDFTEKPTFIEVTTQKSFEGLTYEEKAVLQNLAAAWDSYFKIEKKSSSLQEFNDAIHRCQQLIALRVAKRVNPEVWVQE